MTVWGCTKILHLYFSALDRHPQTSTAEFGIRNITIYLFVPDDLQIQTVATSPLIVWMHHLSLQFSEILYDVQKKLNWFISPLPLT